MWTYQYDGVDKFSTILAWCDQHLDIKDWTTNLNETIWFHNEKTYTMFALRWL